MDNLSNKLQQRILHKALELQNINQSIKASLPLDCHSHINVAGVRENQLILLTDSPVWQTRLRMFTPVILEALHQHTGMLLTQVKIKLAPTKRIIEPEAPASRVLSKNSAKLINQTAQGISDPALREAMLQLSKKAK